MSSTSYMRLFLKSLGALKVATEHKVLGFQGFQSLNLIVQVVDHGGSLANVSFTPMPKGFVPYVEHGGEC